MDSQLQTFLGDFDFQYLIICCDNGLKEYALPLDTGDLSLLKFTCPLKEFCSINNIGVDDVVRFKFQINSPVCRCQVYKIFNWAVLLYCIVAFNLVFEFSLFGNDSCVRYLGRICGLIFIVMTLLLVTYFLLYCIVLLRYVNYSMYVKSFILLINVIG